MSSNKKAAIVLLASFWGAVGGAFGGPWACLLGIALGAIQGYNYELMNET